MVEATWFPTLQNLCQRLDHFQIRVISNWYTKLGGFCCLRDWQRLLQNKDSRCVWRYVRNTSHWHGSTGGNAAFQFLTSTITMNIKGVGSFTLDWSQNDCISFASLSLWSLKVLSSHQNIQENSISDFDLLYQQCSMAAFPHKSLHVLCTMPMMSVLDLFMAVSTRLLAIMNRLLASNSNKLARMLCISGVLLYFINCISSYVWVVTERYFN